MGNYEEYKDCDLSVLTDRQREFLLAAIEGKRVVDIAAEHNLSRQSINLILKTAREKLPTEPGKLKPVYPVYSYRGWVLMPWSDNYTAEQAEEP